MTVNGTSEERKFKVRNKYGIHARPAALFVKTASKFGSEVTVVKGDMEVSGKSIMGLLTIEGYCGSTLTVVANGDDATDTLNALEALFARKFDED